MRWFFTACLVFLASVSGARAQLLDVLTAPVTLIDRAIEARSAGDILTDNEIVVKVNAIMAKVKTAQASTEIYEQRLLITGIFDDKADYDNFEKQVRAVAGVKKLYWQVTYLAANDPKRKALLGWDDVIAMNAKAKARISQLSLEQGLGAYVLIGFNFLFHGLVVEVHDGDIRW